MLDEIFNPDLKNNIKTVQSYLEEKFPKRHHPTRLTKEVLKQLELHDSVGKLLAPEYAGYVIITYWEGRFDKVIDFPVLGFPNKPYIDKSSSIYNIYTKNDWHEKLNEATRELELVKKDFAIAPRGRAYYYFNRLEVLLKLFEKLRVNTHINTITSP
ncbi:hypothetical protein N9J61_02950 [Pelagibacterales bacterium]|nr:hypothetical protein [Pelagibacterales bacterium]